MGGGEFKFAFCFFCLLLVLVILYIYMLVYTIKEEKETTLHPLITLALILFVEVPYHQKTLQAS